MRVAYFEGAYKEHLTFEVKESLCDFMLYVNDLIPLESALDSMRGAFFLRLVADDPVTRPMCR